MTTETKQKIKHWVFSSLHTFIAAFIMALLPFIDTVTVETLDRAMIFGILSAGLRAGIKAIGAYISSSSVIPQE